MTPRSTKKETRWLAAAGTAATIQDELRSRTVLLAIVRKRLGLEAVVHQILLILSLTPFEKTPISCALQALDTNASFTENANQPILFEF